MYIFLFLSSSVIAAKNENADVHLEDNIQEASVPFPLLTNKPLKSVTAQYLPLVANKLKQKIKALDTNVKSGVTQLKTALSNNINAAVVHLDSSVSNKLNAGVAHLKSTVSHKLHSLAEKVKQYKQKPYAAHLEPFLYPRNRLNFQQYEKQQSPMYVSYIIKSPKFLNKPLNKKRAKPNKYDALMTDLGISGYKHFENSVIRDLEKREEQKVEATIHTLFENPKYALEKPSKLPHVLKPSLFEDLHKASSTDSYVAKSSLQNYTTHEDDIVKNETPVNGRNKKPNLRKHIITTTQTPATTEKSHGTHAIDLTREKKSDNNTLMFRWKSPDLNDHKFHSKKESKKVKKDARSVQHKKPLKIHLALTPSPPLKIINRSPLDLKDQESIQNRVISLNDFEISTKKPNHWHKQVLSNQPQETTTMLPNITTQRPTYVPNRSTKRSSHKLTSSRKSLDSYRISSQRKQNAGKVSGYRGSIKFSDNMHSDQ